MSFRSYLAVMLFGSVCCSAALFLVLRYIDPFSTTKMGILLFYASLFGTVVGFSTILFTVVDQFIRFQIPLYKIVQVSFLRAVSIGVLGIFLLLLQSQSWVSPLLFAGVVMLLVIIEYALTASVRNTQKIHHI